MALIIPPGWLQAVYVLSLIGDTEPLVVTCGHKIDSASGATGPQAANDLMQSFGAKVVTARMSNQYALEQVVTYAGNDGPPFVNVSSLARVVGVGVSPVVPQNTAHLIRKRTDVAGRRGRGRMYVPGVQEDAVGPTGVLTPATVTAWNTSFQNWFNDLTVTVGSRFYPPAVLHRSEGAGIEPLPSLITTFVCDGRVATQRRRLRR